MEEELTFINPEDEKRLMLFESIYNEMLEFVAATYTDEEIKEINEAYTRFERRLKETQLSDPDRSSD